MICIIYKEHNKEKACYWNVGETTSFPFLSTKEIICVQTDGDELDFIIKNFSNLPYPKHKSVVLWYGDLAKLIVFNL